MSGRKSKLSPELQARVIQLLSAGVTDDAMCHAVNIGVSTFYMWLDRGQKEIDRINATRGDGIEPKESERLYVEFSEAITRARGNAIANAVLALRQGMMPNEAKEESIETFSETRLDKSGKPYVYTRTTQKTKVIKNPSDWRAAVEYLKRRDRDNWSERQEFTGANGEQLQTPIVYLPAIVNPDDTSDS